MLGVRTDELYERAQAAFQRGNYERAFGLSQEALALTPGDVNWNLLAGRSLIFLQRHDDAVPYLERVLDIDWKHGLASAWAWLHLAEIRLAQGKPADAWRAADAAVGLNASANVTRAALVLLRQLEA